MKPRKDMSMPPATTPPATTPVVGHGRAELSRAAVGGLALVALVLVSYWPSLSGGFVWDDFVLVSKNPLVTGELNLRSVWFAGDFSLATVATWLEWKAFGDHAAGYRLVNVALHAASAVLAWGFLTKLQVRGAWLGAAFFAVHPVAVASVAWVSELKNTLSLVLFLASAWTFLGFADELKAGRAQKARVFYTLSLLAFLLALLAKTSTVALPVVLLAGMWWRDRGFGRQRLVQLIPYFALAASFGLLTIWYQSHQAIRGMTVQTLDFGERLAAAGQALWFYLGKAIVPVKLSMIYPQWEITTNSLVAWLPSTIAVVILALAWRFRAGRGRFILLAIVCFVAALFPVLGMFDMYFMIFSRVSDHLAYLSLLAVTATAAAGVSVIPDRRIGWLVAAPALAILLCLTQQRAKVFSSDEALWRDTITRNPRAWNAHNNLACNLAERGEMAEAKKHFTISLQLNPDNAQAHQNLARGLMLEGKVKEADPHFKAALKLKPDDPETLADYAACLAAMGNSAEAVEHLQAALNMKPNVRYELQLAPLLAGTGQHQAAAAVLEKILAKQPDSFEALNNLAWIRATCPDATVRDGLAAVRLASEACRLSGRQQAVPFGTLAAAYAEAGQFTNAITAARTAIELALASGNEPFANANRQLLRLYERGRPFHLPPPGQPNSRVANPSGSQRQP